MMSAIKYFVVAATIHFMLFQATVPMSFMRQRYFKFEQVGACPSAPTNIGKIEKFQINQPDKFHYYVDAGFSFFKNITAPVKLHIRSIRCSLETDTKCIHNDGLQFGVCEHLQDENALWTPFIKSISPKFSCPMKMGTYKIQNGTVDFSILAHMPLEGFRYSLNFKFYEMTKPKPLDILCLDFTIAISVASNNPSRKRGKPALT